MANETVLFKRGDSATITSTPVTDGQILFDTSGNGKMYLDNGTDRLEMGGAITVDASLSKTSTNAIQNKAVTGNILNSLAEVSAATQQNTIAGALALKEVNSSIGELSSSLGGLIGFPKYDTKIASLTVANGTYTATEDCWCIGLVKQNISTNGASVSVNGVDVCEVFTSGSSFNNERIMIPIKKGQIVKTRQYGEYNLYFYSV